MGQEDHRWHTPWHGRLHFARTTWTNECEMGAFFLLMGVKIESANTFFGDIIVFVHVDHHDRAYASAYEITKALIDDEGLLTTLAKVGVKPEELLAFVESIGR